MYTHLQKLVNNLSDICGVFNRQTQIAFWPNGIRIQTNNWFIIPTYSTSCHKVCAITTCWHYYVSPIYIALCIFWPAHNITQYIKYRKSQSTKQYTPKLLVKNASEGNKYKQFWEEFKSYSSLLLSGVPRNFVRGGGFNKFNWGQREQGSGRRQPPSQGFWRQLQFGTRNFFSYRKIFFIFGTLRLFMMTTNLFVIANVKQLWTRLVLEFYRLFSEHLGVLAS